MTKKLEDAIGADAAAAVKTSPKLGFTYLVGLRETHSGSTFAALDAIFEAHGGILVFPNASPPYEFILPKAAAVALLNHPLTTTFQFMTENTQEGLRAVEFGPSGRTYNGAKFVKSRLPYAPPVIPD